jgi:hypothetical protein
MTESDEGYNTHAKAEKHEVCLDSKSNRHLEGQTWPERVKTRVRAQLRWLKVPKVT